MSLAIQIHLLTVLPAFLLGIYILISTKGTNRHKLVGRSWAILMLVSAFDSFYIRSNGSFSWIHILSVISITSIIIAVWAIRSGNPRTHKRFMIGAYIGVVVAGYFATMTPGRAVYAYLFSG